MANSISGQRTIRNNQLTPDTFVLVRGNIEYSRLTRPIDGEELEKDKRRRAQMGGIPIDKPYTTVTLTNARIVPLKPGQKSIEETYVEERFYRKGSDPADAPLHYAINNKSPYPNQFYQADPGEITKGDQIYPERELANGLDVVLILRVFAASGFAQKGIGLHSVVLQEPLRYYTNDQTRALEAAGIQLRRQPNPNGEAPAIAAAPVEPEAPISQENAFATNPVTPVAAPVAPPMPAPEGPWICPQCGTEVPAGQKFCGTCGARKDDMATNPYQAPQGGIRVDTANRNY